MNCQLCDVEVQPGTEAQRVTGTFAHRVCLLRSATGGIGHLLDHAYWCGLRGDPDGGRSYYQSALEVDDWIAEHGTNAAFAAYDADGIPHPTKDP